MSKSAIKGLLAITAALWLAQPIESDRLWGADSRAEQISDSDKGNSPADQWASRTATDHPDDDKTG